MKPTLTVPLEIKSLAEREFEGHGSVFRNTDLGGDIVVPGAFKRTLAQHRKAGSLPQMFWAHDPSRVPGKWLEMHEDANGLKVRGVLADTDLGNEIHTLLKMEAVRGLSIGYRTLDADYDADGNRLIKEAELWEVSVVSLPMNPLAQVAHVKSQLSALGERVPGPREMEHEFRRMGCSKSVARDLCFKLFGSGVMLEPIEDAGAMLADEKTETPSRCEADDETDAAEMLQSLAEIMLAERIRRKLVRAA